MRALALEGWNEKGEKEELESETVIVREKTKECRERMGHFAENTIPSSADSMKTR
jgi:hypothetical protein